MVRRMARVQRATTSLALVTAMLAGCTVGPAYRGAPATATINDPKAQGAFVSAQGPAFSPDPAPGEWWRLYDDPQLSAMIRRAMSANTDLRVALGNLEHSQALLREVRASLQPQVTLGVSPSYQQFSPEAFLHAGPVPPYALLIGDLSVSYQADLFGQLHRGLQAEKAEDEAVEAAYDLAKITVAAETAKAYVEACGAGEELAAARRILALQQKNATVVARIHALGRAGVLDVTRSKTQVSQAEADIPALEAEKRNALYRLATLQGLPPAEFSRTLETCQAVPRLKQPIPVGDGAALLRRRPDVRAAERELAADTARIGVATADLYPRVTLGASAGTAGILADSFTPATDRYGFGPGITWELNQNVARARIAAAKAQVHTDLANFDGVVLASLRETESALTLYARDLERDAKLRAARDQSAQAAGEAERLYKGGRVDFLSYLDAQRALAAAETAVAASDVRVSADQIVIFLALGGGWEAEPPASSEADASARPRAAKATTRAP